MPIKPFYRADKLETIIRKCILFPADGSDSRIVNMIARTVTVEDIASLKSFSRCVDMSTSYSDLEEYRKTRVMAYRSSSFDDAGEVQTTYLLFYNLSPNLPVNLDIARIMGITPAYLKYKKRLFWTGDVVAMKVHPESEKLNFLVQSLDADFSDVGALEKFFQKKFWKEGVLERILREEELQWRSYIMRFCWPTALVFGAPGLYWGANAAKKEEQFLEDLNELRSVVGHVPIRPHFYMKSYSEHASSLYFSVKSALGIRPKITGPPKLPPELEARIFEICAVESLELCTTLMLVAKRVHAWIDRIRLQTVVLEDFGSLIEKRDRLGEFLARLTKGKPVDQHTIKNLAFFGAFSDNEAINRILSICGAGVENLVLLVSARGFDLLDDPLAGCNLRRLTIQLDKFFPPESAPNFHHPCFARITHLHLYDDKENWPKYAGWDTLTNLTHIAFASADPLKATQLIQNKLRTVQYVVVGHYDDSEMARYAEVAGDGNPDVRLGWGLKNVVFLAMIPQGDWERGARGRGDFWNIVEWEVKKQREEGLVTIELVV